MKTLAFFLPILALSISTMAQHATSFTVQVETDKGMIEGYYDTKDDLQKFFGVPYAQPPIGELRWRVPQPREEWEGVLETKSFGPRPVQAPIYSDMQFRSDGLSEDCLYLNIWSPTDKTPMDLPVLVYFHGGGFLAGDGSEYRYDGGSMAKKGIVVITVSYRLNIFGFLAHPELSEEGGYKASGNYGLLDQNAAIMWVKKNVAAFGGNPEKITIAGESAGSIAVSMHMASPLSKKLIAGAIGESGAAIAPTFAPVSLIEAENTGAEFMTKAGLKSIKELRELSTQEIYELYLSTGSIRFPTVVDGYFLGKELPEVFEAHEQAQVPLLLGWNSAESMAQYFLWNQPFTPENFTKKVKEEYPTIAKKLLKVYPHENEEQVEMSATALASDRFMGYSTWKWFDLHRRNSEQLVYRYLFDKPRPVEQGVPEPLGATHSAEIEYCMGNLPLNEAYKWTDEDYQVSELMQQFFANFIKTGNPNGDNLPEWPIAKAEEKTSYIMKIGVQSKAVEATNDVRYTVLEKVYGE